jgi:hypothetical protein
MQRDASHYLPSMLHTMTKHWSAQRLSHQRPENFALLIRFAITDAHSYVKPQVLFTPVHKIRVHDY